MSFPRSSHLARTLLPLAALTLVAAAEPPSEGSSTPPARPPQITEAVSTGIPADPGEIRIYEPFQVWPTPVTAPQARVGLEAVGRDRGSPQVLTAGQLAKLARAREAVERSRAAGTLQVLTPPELDAGPTLLPEAIAAMKLEKLRTQEPLPYDPVGTPSRGEEGE